MRRPPISTLFPYTTLFRSSRVDAGTIELIRGMGVDVVSSGDLIQQFESHWNDAAIATHRAASDKLYRIKDRARSEEHTSELQSQSNLVCRLLLEKKNILEQ